MIPHIRRLLEQFQCEELRELYEEMDELGDLYQVLDAAIVEEPPLAMKEGGIIKQGYHPQIDEFREAKTKGKEWLAELEASEKEKTGIRTLKVKYNKVFGYYLEVTNSFKDMVPEYYTRKQTLTNAERYITPRLKELEDMILGAEDKLYALEYEEFVKVRTLVAGEVERIQRTAKAIAKLDAYVSMALVASRNHYVRPRINTRGVIDIKNGRHPVVEKMISNDMFIPNDTYLDNGKNRISVITGPNINTRGVIDIKNGRHPVVEKMISNDMFIPNDTYLDNGKNRISVITGPNIAGKSTYMRQSALIVLMAQIGSFVPAEKANIGIVDRIFTRVGASDDLASGQSTFMVEMTEVANILRNATSKSLLILDEIGRGTSTFDGLSIAWAVIEHISNPRILGAKTLFATHYHELTELEGKLAGVNNSTFDGLSIAWAVIEHISNPRILGAKTLFATHYHELTELEGKLAGVNNYCIAVKERGDDIVFLRKIVKGGADKSYGIQVAKLAGVPDSVIERAKELVEELVSADITTTVKNIASENKKSRPKPAPHYDEVDMKQMSLFDTVKDDDVLEELKSIRVDELRPVDALNILYQLQNKLKNRW